MSTQPREIRSIIREDGGASESYNFKSTATTEGEMIKEVLTWFAAKHDEQRAENAQVIITNLNELKLT